MRKQIKTLEARVQALVSSYSWDEYPGPHLFDMPLGDYGKGVCMATKQLGAGFAGRYDGSSSLRLFAVMKP